MRLFPEKTVDEAFEIGQRCGEKIGRLDIVPYLFMSLAANATLLMAVLALLFLRSG